MYEHYKIYIYETEKSVCSDLLENEESRNPTHIFKESVAFFGLYLPGLIVEILY